MPKVVGKDESVIKRITCRNCGAINEYVPHDVHTLYQGRDITGCSEGTKGFNCAGCDKEIVTESW